MSQENQAQYYVNLIKDGKAGTEDLKRGVSLAVDLFGENSFTHFFSVLYENDRQPGRIHQAISELADFQYVHDRRGRFPGWDGIITYNFDDLLGEALDKRNLGRIVWAMFEDGLRGKPNKIQYEAGKNSEHLDIFHLHGFTPREPLLPKHMIYTISKSQYQKTYKYRGRDNQIINYVFNRYLANPVHYALYVGCSFKYEGMNVLLRDAASQLPGRQHYALIEWPEPNSYYASNAQEIHTYGLQQ